MNLKTINMIVVKDPGKKRNLLLLDLGHYSFILKYILNLSSLHTYYVFKTMAFRRMISL